MRKRVLVLITAFVIGTGLLPALLDDWWDVGTSGLNWFQRFLVVIVMMVIIVSLVARAILPHKHIKPRRR